MNTLEQKLVKDMEDTIDLRDGSKFRLISFSIGFLTGILFNEPKDNFGYIGDFSLGLGDFFAVFVPGFIYFENKIGGRTKENSFYNSKICFVNYSIGYFLGYQFPKLFN